MTELNEVLADAVMRYENPKKKKQQLIEENDDFDIEFDSDDDSESDDDNSIDSDRKKKKDKLKGKNKEQREVEETEAQLDIKTARKLVQLLSKKRAYEYYPWICVGWALHNTSVDLYDAFTEFSRKSTEKFDESSCQKD